MVSPALFSCADALRGARRLHSLPERQDAPGSAGRIAGMPVSSFEQNVFPATGDTRTFPHGALLLVHRERERTAHSRRNPSSMVATSGCRSRILTKLDGRSRGSTTSPFKTYFAFCEEARRVGVEAGAPNLNRRSGSSPLMKHEKGAENDEREARRVVPPEFLSQIGNRENGED